MAEDKKVPKDEEATEAAPPEPDPPAAGVLIQEVRQGFQAIAEAIEVVSRAAAPSASVDLSIYRTITAARGIQEVNTLLAQGWDLISAEYCEEVRTRRGIGAKPAVIAWTLYATVGKRESLAESDRKALAVDEERRAFETGTPVEGDGAPASAAPAEDGEPAPVGTMPRGRHLTAASPRQTGHEGTGALANR